MKIKNNINQSRVINTQLIESINHLLQLNNDLLRLKANTNPNLLDFQYEITCLPNEIIR